MGCGPSQAQLGLLLCLPRNTLVQSPDRQKALRLINWLSGSFFNKKHLTGLPSLGSVLVTSIDLSIILFLALQVVVHGNSPPVLYG